MSPLYIKNLLQNLTNLVVVMNENSQVEYVSPSSKRILGFDSKELLGDGWWKYTKENEDERKAVKRHLKSLWAAGTNMGESFERSILTSNGDQKWILWETTTTVDNRLVGIGHEITERKKLETEVHEQNSLLKETNQELLASLEYASMIQQAQLPFDDIYTSAFSEAFVLYEPRDIVSGDFFWGATIDGVLVSAVIDCTGHGVPGALLTIMANAALRQIVVQGKETQPDKILYALDEWVTNMLNENASIDRCEGMDISICSYNKAKLKVQFSGAYNPLLMFRNGELFDFTGSKNPIGYFYGLEKTFELEEIKVQKGDTLYMMSDGYTDQFGGENVKKFNRRRFKTLLLSIQEFDLKKQKKILKDEFQLWKGKSSQIDDVTVMGLRV